MAIFGVDDRQKQWGCRKRRKFSCFSRTIVVLTATIVTALSFININLNYVCIYSFGVFSVSVSLVAEKTKNNFRKRKDCYL